MDGYEQCDRCPARFAVVVAKIAEGDHLSLTFCSHHADQFMPDLVGQGFHVELDTRVDEIVGTLDPNTP